MRTGRGSLYGAIVPKGPSSGADQAPGRGNSRPKHRDRSAGGLRHCVSGREHDVGPSSVQHHPVYFPLRAPGDSAPFCGKQLSLLCRAGLSQKRCRYRPGQNFYQCRHRRRFQIKSKPPDSGGGFFPYGEKRGLHPCRQNLRFRPFQKRNLPVLSEHDLKSGDLPVQRFIGRSQKSIHQSGRTHPIR